MRTQVDIEKIKKLTIEGQISKIEKNKALGIKERERVPEAAIDETAKVSVTEKASTLKSLLQQRHEKARLYNAQNFKTFKVGIHGGKPIPKFYVPPTSALASGDETGKNLLTKVKEGVAEADSQATVDWYAASRAGEKGVAVKPSIVSHRQLLQKQKFWAKKDELYQNEFDECEAKPDKFKVNRVITT